MKDQILQKINPGLSARQYLQIAGLIIFSFLAGFVVAEQLQDQQERLELDNELNSSNSVTTVEFYNQSIDFMMERGEEPHFYIDRDRDGSADERMELERDGDIHQDVQLEDTPDNIYRIFYRYQIDGENSWMQIYRVEPLKPVN